MSVKSIHESYRQLGIAVQELRDIIYKELHLEQICEWLEKTLQRIAKYRR